MRLRLRENSDIDNDTRPNDVRRLPIESKCFENSSDFGVSSIFIRAADQSGGGVALTSTLGCKHPANGTRYLLFWSFKIPQLAD
jgi:hypothetical protein